VRGHQSALFRLNLSVRSTGGYTQANFKGVNFITAAGAPIAPPLSIDENRYTGWFLGSGYEYRFDWLPGLLEDTSYWRICALGKIHPDGHLFAGLALQLVALI
jgi:hypothetical protein